MPWDLTVELENRPGTLADLGEATGAAGLNLGGGCGVISGDVGEIHVLVDDVDAATSAIESAGISVRGSREVLVVDVEDYPGSLGEVARRIADAGANIDLIYLATGTRLVIGADDLDRAGAALSGA